MKCKGLINDKCEQSDNKDDCLTEVANYKKLNEESVVAIDLP